MRLNSPAVGPLHGIRVVDLSRILAGPTATQLLGDFGADIIKVEHPERGDDTRGWGPPYVEGDTFQGSELSAYFIAANRNKRSVALDISKPESQHSLRQLISTADILVENFKVGGLRQYGLSYDDLRGAFPRLIYCSITGFGQTGPWAARPGYDLLAQAMGGIMSITGEPDGGPMKVGVGVADMMCGVYAASGILAAIHNRSVTGCGQHIDISLLDCQIAWLANAATNFFVTGALPMRLGNAHPNIVPYRVYEVADGHFVLAIGNDIQFRQWCDLVERRDLCDRFPTNTMRVEGRAELEPQVETIMRRWTKAKWDAELAERNIPGGPVNLLNEVFAHPQVEHRQNRLSIRRHGVKAGVVEVLGNPVRFSASPISYRYPPPFLGEHTDEILSEISGDGG